MVKECGHRMRLEMVFFADERLASGKKEDDHRQSVSIIS